MLGTWTGVTRALSGTISAMSRWEPVGIFSALLVLSGTAFAQGDGPGVEPAPEVLEVGASGLPGGARIGYAESLPGGTVTTAFTAGFGFRSGLLDPDHSMSRGMATAALAYSISDLFSASLMLDGRYDKHSGGTGGSFDDDGWVGEPRLHLRAGKTLGKIGAGAEITVWVPGKDAPSIVAEATSVDARALLTLRVGGAARVAVNAGFRLDNSAKSAKNFTMLSASDQASLGVSQWHAIVGGARFAYPMGKLTFGVEAEVNAYVGGPDTPSAPSPSVGIGASASYRINETLSAELFLTSNIQEKPTMAGDGSIALIPYAPLFGGGLGISARFGGPNPAGPALFTTCDDPDPAKRPPSCPPPPDPTAVLGGQVTDDTGAPLAGATVTVTDGKGKVVTATTDATGRWRTEGLATGEVTVDVEAAERVKQSAKVMVNAGDNTAPITALAPVIPPGRLRFVIRSFATSKGIDAQVEVNPGGHKLDVLADGSTELDIPPGTYTVKVSAANHTSQTREYVVDQRSVVIVNVDLRK
jgi:hypothetical protein